MTNHQTTQRSNPRLLNKVALITGAARGIGAAIAQAFVEQGATVIVSDLVTIDANPVTQFLRLDVRSESDWQRVTTQIKAQFGRLDILVNNAGISGFEVVDGARHDPELSTLEDWHRVLQTNLDGVFLGCKYAIQAMRAQASGAIINIGSRSGVVGIPRAAAYAASKAAIRNHSKSVALYCAEEQLNIRCNCIQPAAILTEMWEPMLGTGPEREQRMRAFTADCPMQRFGTVEEVAALAVLLASDEACYINGAELNIDGGLLAGSAAVLRPT